jgi:enoyl-CoA hydratase/carnithine racemase
MAPPYQQEIAASPYLLFLPVLDNPIPSRRRIVYGTTGPSSLRLHSACHLAMLAAVQGGCVGGGFELALTCDIIIAGRSTRFSCSEPTVGILTLQGGMLQLADRLGPARAAELVFLSEPVSAEQLCAWNVVNREVDDAALEQEARDVAVRLATGPTRAYAATKALWRLQAEAGGGAARQKLYDRSMPLFETRAAKAALRAAAEAVDAGRPFPKMTFEGR